MPKSPKSKEDIEYLKRVGERISQAIQKNGYKSVYDFWINSIGDDISRSTLNAIVKGETDMSLTTLRKISKALKIRGGDLL